MTTSIWPSSLQPLRIPSGWQVCFNDGLYEIDPEDKAVSADNCIIFFKEDMLQLRHANFNRLLDVGWYPAGNTQRGEYRLFLYAGDFTGQLLHQFGTRNRQMLVTELERLLLAVTARIL